VLPSRALGFLALKRLNKLVLAEPEVAELDADARDAGVLVLLSPSVAQVVPDADVREVVLEALGGGAGGGGEQRASERLAEEALRRGASATCACVVVRFAFVGGSGRGVSESPRAHQVPLPTQLPGPGNLPTRLALV